ncbi:MAG: hypothetical protein J1F07_04945 [Muribaculaceae bacterium]|nr:hypothetical protein [Muribaculaceae bacterium]
MKKYFKLLFVALFATMTIALTACGDDEPTLPDKEINTDNTGGSTNPELPNDNEDNDDNNDNNDNGDNVDNEIENSKEEDGYGDPAYASKYENNPDYFGFITVYNDEGNVLYTRDVYSAGYYFYKTDIDDKYATLLLRAYVESDGSLSDGIDHVYKNANTINEIYIQDHLTRIPIGKIANHGYAYFTTFKKEGGHYIINSVRGWFDDGDVEVVYVKNEYIIVKFTNCQMEMSGKNWGRFNGEIKFELKPGSFF